MNPTHTIKMTKTNETQSLKFLLGYIWKSRNYCEFKPTNQWLMLVIEHFELHFLLNSRKSIRTNSEYYRFSTYVYKQPKIILKDAETVLLPV